MGAGTGAKEAASSSSSALRLRFSRMWAGMVGPIIPAEIVAVDIVGRARWWWKCCRLGGWR